MDNNKPGRFAVVGNPVAHSMSPAIHQSFARQFGLQLNYEKILAEKNNFTQIVTAFFQQGGNGLNITTPFKSQAAAFVDDCSPVASASNSVNTLFMGESGVIRGDSTDGRGWLSDIRRLKIDLKNKNVLLIGAGGAARIILNALLDEPVKSIHICNRTEHRATDRLLANEKKLTASNLSEIPQTKWDLIINSLSVGWQGKYPEIQLQIHEHSTAYDLNYGQGAEPFKAWFLDLGGKKSAFHDGWGMLVEQAAESFNLWWQLRPETEEIIKSGKP